MIPLAVPNLEGREREYLNKCIDTTFVSSVGEFVNRIEEMTAQECGAKYGVATSSGTTGLHLSLVGCGVGYGDIVIIPSFTFIATANAVAHCGAVPWLMDIDRSWTMNIDQLENELDRNAALVDGKCIHKLSGRRVAAIMPVYTLGNIPDMYRLNVIAKKYNLPVIADAAAAIGATRDGRALADLAMLSVISFNGNKTVTAGGGGMVVGNDEALLKKLKHLSTTARVTAEYDHDMVGYNYRMTNIQAAVGCAQLERLDSFIERKRAVRHFYNDRLKDIEGISFFPPEPVDGSTCWFSGFVLDKGNLNVVREICKELKAQGIEGRSFWKPVHLQKPYEHALKADSLEFANNIWDRIITLPCSTHITDAELDQVVSTVRQILPKYL